MFCNVLQHLLRPNSTFTLDYAWKWDGVNCLRSVASQRDLKRVTLVLHAGRPQNAKVFDEFAASQPLGYESCLDTPERYLYTKKLFKTKRAPWRWAWFQQMNDSKVFKCAGCNRNPLSFFTGDHVVTFVAPVAVAWTNASVIFRPKLLESMNFVLKGTEKPSPNGPVQDCPTSDRMFFALLPVVVYSCLFLL